MQHIASGLLLTTTVAFAGTYSVTSDYTSRASYPLQKAQVGVSYANKPVFDLVHDVLLVRSSRNNDKRLQLTWQGVDANGDPVYDDTSGVLGLVDAAETAGAIGGVNLQGPIEHPAPENYRIGTEEQNQWDWVLFGYDSMLYRQYIAQQINAAGPADYPFIFGIGHEPTNTRVQFTSGQYSLAPGNKDGAAFMGPYADYYAIQDDVPAAFALKAENYFDWYEQTILALRDQLNGRSRFIVAAPFYNADPNAPSFLQRFHDLVNGESWIYKPDYIGAHNRNNVPKRFLNLIVEPSREIFYDQPLWKIAPLVVNEMGVSDVQADYIRTVRAASRELTLISEILRAPDVAHVNWIYSNYLGQSDGTAVYPAFHALRFFQNMPERRTVSTGGLADDIQIFTSMELGTEHAAILWRDDDYSSETHTVNLTLANNPGGWAYAKAYLYVMGGDTTQPLITSPDDPDYGMANYLVQGYPVTLTGSSQINNYTFNNITLPPGSVAMIKLVRVTANGSEFLNNSLADRGPEGVRLIKRFQWTGRNGTPQADPVWGYFDNRNWTLFAGIDNLDGELGAAQAHYLAGQAVKRGMAAAEFKCNSLSDLAFEISVDQGNFNPATRNTNAIGGVRIDFFNGTANAYDSAIVIVGNIYPDTANYLDDIPWGYGGNNTSISPQAVAFGQIFNGSNFTVDLDATYQALTGKTSAADFIAGDRRIVVTAIVENMIGNLVVRLRD